MVGLTRHEMLDRFRREARAVAAVNHPAIVTIYSVEEADGLHFLTMEFVEGRTCVTNGVSDFDLSLSVRLLDRGGTTHSLEAEPRIRRGCFGPDYSSCC